MKISKLFHWLYASLMLLPFASVVSTTLYYSFNKNAVIPQVNKEVSKEVNFNQILPSTIVTQTYTNNGFTSHYYSDDNSYTISGTYTSNTTLQVIGADFSSMDILTLNHKYLVNITGFSGAVSFSTDYQQAGYISGPYIFTASFSGGNYFNVRANITGSTSCSGYINLFDLTYMFGEGNEPSATQFISWFPNDSYPYTLSEHIVIPNYETIQVADNSINHFWLPSFGAIGYNIQSYIGWLIGSVFGLNVVNGIGFVIVRLFTYWLIISICWLIFDVLMYVPNLVHKWLDKAAID